jgi:serine/threonine protein kinase
VTNYSKDGKFIVKTKSSEHEHSIYDHLRDLRGFPPFMKLCSEAGDHHLHLPLLGQPLLRFLKSDRHAFSLKTICMLANQLINRIKALHSKGIVHRSIQPDHIVVDETNVVYLISYSRAMWLSDGMSTGKHRALYNRAEYLTSK